MHLALYVVRRKNINQYSITFLKLHFDYDVVESDCSCGEATLYIAEVTVQLWMVLLVGL